MWVDWVRQWFSLSPTQLIALTARAEAGTDWVYFGDASLQAIINVIHNRRIHPPQYFYNNPNIIGAQDILRETGSPYHAVILGKAQFSCYLPGVSPKGIEYAQITKNYTSPEIFNAYLPNNKCLQAAMKLVDMLVAGTLPDITGGADFYCNPQITEASIVENWNRTMVYRTTIGNHRFWSAPPHYWESPQKMKPDDYVAGTPQPELLRVIVPSVGIITGT
jgi:hypothetical protein